MFAFERKTVLKEELNFPGLIPEKYIHLMSLLSLLGLMSMLFFSNLTDVQKLICLPLVILSARIIAVDLCHQLILNIYVFPLIILGLILPQYFGLTTWASSYISVGCVILFMLCVMGLQKLSTGKAGVGMGDYKFMILMALWLGGSGLLTAVFIAFLISLPLFFIPKKGEVFVPMAPGLVTGFFAVLCYQNQIENLLLKLFTAIH